DVEVERAAAREVVARLGMELAEVDARRPHVAQREVRVQVEDRPDAAVAQHETVLVRTREPGQGGHLDERREACGKRRRHGGKLTGAQSRKRPPEDAARFVSWLARVSAGRSRTRAVLRGAAGFV